MTENERILQEMRTEIENFVEEGKQSRFDPGKVTLDDDILMEMLEKFRKNVPAEVERSQQIMQTKQTIINDAKAQADLILNNAMKETNEAIENSEIVKMANRRADDIETSAEQYADDLLLRARSEAKQIRLGAMEYTKDMLGSMDDYLTTLRQKQVDACQKMIDDIAVDLANLRSNNAEMEEQIQVLMADGRRARTIDDI